MNDNVKCTPCGYENKLICIVSNIEDCYNIINIIKQINNELNEDIFFCYKLKNKVSFLENIEITCKYKEKINVLTNLIIDNDCYINKRILRECLSNNYVKVRREF